MLTVVFAVYEIYYIFSCITMTSHLFFYFTGSWFYFMGATNGTSVGHLSKTVLNRAMWYFDDDGVVL